MAGNLRLNKRPSNLNGFVLSPKEDAEERTVNHIKLPERFEKYISCEKSHYTPWSPTGKFVFPVYSLPPQLSPECSKSDDESITNVLPRTKHGTTDRDQSKHKGHHVHFEETVSCKSLDFNANKSSRYTEQSSQILNNNVDERRFKGDGRRPSRLLLENLEEAEANKSPTPSLSYTNVTSPEGHQTSDIQTAIDWIRQEVKSLKQQDRFLMRRFIALRSSIYQLKCSGLPKGVNRSLDLNATFPLVQDGPISEPCLEGDSPTSHADLINSFATRAFSVSDWDKDWNGTL